MFTYDFLRDRLNYSRDQATAIIALADADAAVREQAQRLADRAAPSAARMAREVRITTDANTVDLLAIRDGAAPEHIRNAAVAELARRGVKLPGTTTCPKCGNCVEAHREGWLYDHTATGNPADDLCPGSGHSPG